VTTPQNRKYLSLASSKPVNIDIHMNMASFWKNHNFCAGVAIGSGRLWAAVGHMCHALRHC
jgi:hypothetical protein